MRDAVRPLDEGDRGQLGKPKVHGFAVELVHLRGVGRGLAHLIDQRVVGRVLPAPRHVGWFAGGLDKAAVVLAQHKIGIAHRAEVADQVRAGRALTQARGKIRSHAEGGVNAGLFELGDEHRRQILKVGEDVDDHAQALPVLFPEHPVVFVAFAGENLRALFQVKNADLVLGDQVLGEGKIPMHLRQIGQGQQGPCT